MMEVMEYLAFGAGALIGYIYLSKNINYILIVTHYSLFKSRVGFDAMYAMADDEVTYEYYKAEVKEFKTYAGYLRTHKAAQPSSYERFRRYYDALVKMLLTRIIPIVLLPAIIFLSNWYYYFIGVIVVFVGLLAYNQFVKRNRVGLYQRLMVFAILRDYIKDMKKAK
jgi:hypothetical protein